MASVSGILMRSVVPWPGLAEQVHGAADTLDVGSHDVHSNAASGDLGDRLRRGEPRQEDQIDRFAIGEARRLFVGR